jgi:Flp pilus assembly protein TadG
MLRKLTSPKGASAVEFGLILPVLIAILIGIMEFGILMYNQQVITNASREGARAGIVAAGTRLNLIDDTIIVSGVTVNREGIKTIVEKYAKNHLITFDFSKSPTPLTVNWDHSSGQNFGDPLKVTVTYGYSFLLFPISNYIMTAVTVMRYE